jgi:hypothetical protein
VPHFYPAGRGPLRGTHPFVDRVAKTGCTGDVHEESLDELVRVERVPGKAEASEWFVHARQLRPVESSPECRPRPLTSIRHDGRERPPCDRQVQLRDDRVVASSEVLPRDDSGASERRPRPFRVD